ncbi:MAG: phytoene/squalene synthase family protein, partial [Anaerolineales bacterium]|nr:phytoene/squalene synthase family protein [Anaerolineales bacterium]
MVVRSGPLESARGAQTAVEELVSSRQDYAYCRAVMVQASKNYTYASRFLPSRARPHVEALYALLRVGDDRVDVSHAGFSSPQAAIDDWERRYHRAFEQGDSEHPVLRAYVHTAYKFEIPERVMQPYFRAMRDDLSVTRFSTFSDLLGYVEGSAVPVGRAMTYILEVREPYNFDQALRSADQLSIAMQLSNFWRDIGEDWQRGRVYIPQQDLAEFGVKEGDLANFQ